jgi:two-component system, NarL family, nitrate/nitrite response regulator NarL
LTSAHILIVDDDTPVRAALTEVLTRRIGCQITCAHPDVPDVVACCQTNTPDLIIVDDWCGGRRTGLALALQIRVGYPHVPMLLVHDRDCSAALETAMAAGIQGFVLKGSSPDQLIASVQTVLAGRTSYPPSPSVRDTTD